MVDGHTHMLAHNLQFTTFQPHTHAYAHTQPCVNVKRLHTLFFRRVVGFFFLYTYVYLYMRAHKWFYIKMGNVRTLECASSIIRYCCCSFFFDLSLSLSLYLVFLCYAKIVLLLFIVLHVEIPMDLMFHSISSSVYVYFILVGMLNLHWHLYKWKYVGYVFFSLSLVVLSIFRYRATMCGHTV